jgi:predicted secreted Zn-dependent protease
MLNHEKLFKINKNALNKALMFVPVVLALATLAFTRTIDTNQILDVFIDPNIKYSEVNQYYLVAGSTPEEIRKSLDDSPVCGAAWGCNHYDVNYSYKFKKKNDKCSIESFTVNLKTTITLPSLDTSKQNVSVLLINKWNQFLVKLKSHEGRHTDISKNGAQEIYAFLNKGPSAQSCQTLDQSIMNQADAIIVRTNLNHNVYDRYTDNGFTEGVNFP